MPRLFARVHRSFRTPYAALAVIVCAVCVGAATFGIVGKSTGFGHVQLIARTAVVAAYVLVAVASVRFLSRIGGAHPSRPGGGSRGQRRRRNRPGLHAVRERGPRLRYGPPPWC